MLKKLLYQAIIFPFSLLGFLSCTDKDVLHQSETDWLMQQDSIVVALYPYYPPYQFINNQNRIDGLLIEHLDLIEKKIGYSFQKKQYDNWPKLINDTQNGKIDIVLEIQRTENRDEFLNFHTKLFQTPFVIISKNEVTSGLTLEHFYNKTITVPEEYGIHDYLRKNHPQLIIKPHKDELTCLRMMQSGLYDAYIAPKAVAHYLMKSEKVTNLKIVSEMSYSYIPSIGVNKKNKKLNDVIAKATISITDKEKQLLIDNWLFNVVSPYYQKPVFWIILSAIALSILILILSANYYLKRIIREKTKALRIEKEKAEESDRLKNSFIQNISYEIKSPLNCITSFSELLKDEDLSPENKKKYSKTIINCGEQLVRIIDNILEVSKLQAEQIKLHPEKTNIDELFQTLFSIFQIKAEQKDIDFFVEERKHNSPEIILVDKAKLLKTLCSLIDNAIKFTFNGHVKISYETKNGLLIIAIEDTGIGIKTADQKKIFKCFAKSKIDSSKRLNELGLGLTIVKEDVDLMDGIISFNSEEHKGTTFTLILPYNDIVHSENKLYQTQKTKFDQNKVPFKSEKQQILIAEDGQVNYTLVKTLLTKMTDNELVIHRAKNGQQAVNICIENPYIDLILMDIRMPILNGYKATKRIKKIRPQLPVIAQTAYSTKEDIKKALDAGCDDFLSKPINRKELEIIIQKHTMSTYQNNT